MTALDIAQIVFVSIVVVLGLSLMIKVMFFEDGDQK